MSLGIKIYHMQDFIRKNEEGIISHSRSVDIIRDLCTAASFHVDSNILVDLRKSTVTGASFTDLINLAEEFVNLLPDFKNKIAAIVPDEPDRIKNAKKFETCMRVKNIRYRIFTDYEMATDWLSEIKS